MHGDTTPNKSWLAILRHYTLQELSEAAYQYKEDGEDPMLLIGILYDIQGMNVTPDAADQIELIDNDQVHAWLGVSYCTTLTVACFLQRAAVATPAVATVLVIILVLQRTIRAISIRANSTLRRSTASNILTLMWRTISDAT